MVFIYFFSGIIAITGSFVGLQPWFRFEKLNKSLLLNGSLIALALFTLLMFAWFLGYFPQSVAAPFMMFIYSFLAGFFAGYAWRMIRLRNASGNVLYMHRSFWVDHAPQLAAILILLFGLYRTSILSDPPVTGIRLTSGLSLVSFGFLGLSLRIVPEFRAGGILLLDQLIPWNHLISWSWNSEDVIRIEYIYPPKNQNQKIREFLTAVPEEDRHQIETVLSSQMEDFSEEREALLKEH